MTAKQYQRLQGGRYSNWSEIIKMQPNSVAENLDFTFEPSFVVMEVCTILSLNMGASFGIIYDDEESDAGVVVHGSREGCERAVRTLILNARDALPGVGEIFVRVASERFDSQTRCFSAGSYIRISVAYIAVQETGIGQAAIEEVPRLPKDIKLSVLQEENTVRLLTKQKDMMISVENESGEKTVSLWYPKV